MSSLSTLTSWLGLGLELRSAGLRLHGFDGQGTARGMASSRASKSCVAEAVRQVSFDGRRHAAQSYILRTQLIHYSAEAKQYTTHCFRRGRPGLRLSDLRIHVGFFSCTHSILIYLRCVDLAPQHELPSEALLRPTEDHAHQHAAEQRQAQPKAQAEVEGVLGQPVVCAGAWSGLGIGGLVV